MLRSYVIRARYWTVTYPPRSHLCRGQSVCVGIFKGDFGNYQLCCLLGRELSRGWGQGWEDFPLCILWYFEKLWDHAYNIYSPKQNQNNLPCPWLAFPLPLASAGVSEESAAQVVLRVVLSISAPQSSSLPVRKQHSVTGNTSFSHFCHRWLWYREILKFLCAFRFLICKNQC